MFFVDVFMALFTCKIDLQDVTKYFAFQSGEHETGAVTVLQLFLSGS